MILNKLNPTGFHPISYADSSSERIRIATNKHLQSPEYLVFRRKELDRRKRHILKQCLVCQTKKMNSSKLKVETINYYFKQRPKFYFVCHDCCVHEDTEVVLYALNKFYEA